MSVVFNRCTVWIVDRPWLSIALLLFISYLAYIGYASPRFFDQLFAADAFETTESSPGNENRTLPDVDPISVEMSDALIVAESTDFFTPRGAKAMRAAVASLKRLPHVTDVLWLDEIPVINIFGLPEPLLPSENAPQGRFDAARDKAKQHPLVSGQFLSDDAELMVLMVNFDYLMIRDDRDCDRLLDQTVTTAVAPYDDVDIEFLVTGRVPFYLTAMANHEENRLTYQIVAYCMIAILSIILFRGVTAMIVVAIAPALGVFWTLGIIRFLDFQDSPFNDVVLPILISLVGFTDGVHLIVQIRRNRVAGMTTFEAARAGIRQVGLACALTSLTTAIGFGSLSLAHHEIIREFGWSCVIGVVLTFVAVIMVIPLVCASRLGNQIHIGYERGLIDRNLDRISVLIDWVLHHQRVLSVTGIALTALFAGISLTLEPDERQTNAVPDQSEAAVAIRKMDQALGGLEYASVELKWNQSVDDDSPEILEVIRKIDHFLNNEPLIGHPISIHKLLQSLPGEGSAADRMSMLELLPPPLKRAFYTPENRSAQVSFRVQDLGIAAYGPVFERLENRLNEIESEHQEFEFVMSGSAIWRWENLYQIVVDLAASLGAASFIIFVVLTLTYRSLRIGLISIIPNLFPLAIAGGYLVLAGYNLEVVMVCAFTCCLGIAVDDTIHFLTRYLELLKVEKDQEIAIRRAFTGVGTALIMTTVVLVAGFLTVLSSDSRDHRIFASMGAITVTAALFADLVFLPAMLARFNPVDPKEVQVEE